MVQSGAAAHINLSAAGLQLIGALMQGNVMVSRGPRLSLLTASLEIAIAQTGVVEMRSTAIQR